MGELNRKIIISIICSIIIFISFIMISNSVYAENKTSNESSIETTVKEKSSNANLKDFGIKPHDFSGFKPDNTSYEVTVPEDTESVEIYAILQDENAQITGTGIKKLELGDNNFDVTVIAEDGTKKTYKINIIRGGQEAQGQQEDKKEEENVEEQNTEEVQEQYSGDGLSNLNIENLELSPSFDTVIYEYTAKYIGEKTSLDIKTTTTDPYYTVEITGNEELKEGENIINVLVSDPDGKNVATYQITVNKSMVDEEAIAKEQEEARKKEQQTIIIGGAIGLIILVIIIVLIIRHRRDKSWAKQYSLPFSGLNNDEELPKLLRDDNDNFDTKSINNFVENEEELTKEQAREKFLNNYNNDSNYDNYKEVEYTPRRKKHKGKRFK